MFHPFDKELVDYLDEWLKTAEAGDIQILSQILSESFSDFVFEHRAFVERFLDKAHQFGKKQLDSAMGHLFRASMSGVKQGLPGEPFPQDVSMKEKAEEALKEISRFSPAFRLYDDLKKHAEQNIGRSVKSRENFDDE